MLNPDFRRPSSSSSSSSAPRPILTLKTSPVQPSEVKARSRDVEQMEHAFLDLDDEGDPSNEEWTFRGKLHAEKVLDSLNMLRQEGSFCDVTIKVEERDFPMHKCVLAAVSKYFKAMFTTALCESQQQVVTLNGLTASVAELLFEYAYTAEVKITKNNVQNLLAAANLLDIMPVLEACCLYLDKHMDENNSLGIANFAEMHACQELQKKARKYSLKRFNEIIEGEEFLSISQSQLIDLISSDDLVCDREEQVFTSVIRWLESSRETRESEFHRVLAHVRLPLISPYFLHDFVERTSLLGQSKECMRLIEEARLYHLLPDRRPTFNSERTRPRISTGLQGSVVCVGGEDDKVVLRSVESWNPVTDVWKQLACLPFAVSKHGLVVSGSNQMYMAGGEYPDGSASKAVWRYDPKINIWQEMAPMLTKRSELGLALLDGFVYAVGGWEGSARLDSVERYETDTNSWAFVAPLKMAVTSPSVVAMEGCLYVCGGAVLEDGDGIDLVQKLDLSSCGKDAVAGPGLRAEWAEVASMLIPRSGSAACVVNGYIFVIGGWHASTENTNKVERFDPHRNQWNFVCPMHERRYRPGVAVSHDQRFIYVMGGEEGWDRYHDTVERYDVERDRWEKVSHLPSARSWLSCVALKVKSDSLVDPS